MFNRIISSSICKDLDPKTLNFESYERRRRLWGKSRLEKNRKKSYNIFYNEKSNTLFDRRFL